MATYLERAQAIGTALLNRPVTLPELDKWGRALAFRASRVSEYDAASAEQKAQFIVVESLRAATGTISHMEEEIAASTARATAAATVKSNWAEV